MKFSELDQFTQGYIDALFFTDSGDIEDEIQDEGFYDFADETLSHILLDCAKFQADNAELLALAYDRVGYEESSAGHDFWLTRNGHGAGFWDRSPLDADNLGDKLTKAADLFNEISPYLGDDSKIYLT